jgi:hypothetical protein
MANSAGTSASAQRPDSIDSPATRDRSRFIDPSGAIKAVKLGDHDVTESSGLALSNRQSLRFWTHNDSGGKSIIYAFDSTGKPTGKCRLRSVGAKDWEDMCSFLDGAVPRLLIADCGDNQAKRQSVSLYLLDEPDPDKDTETRNVLEISVSYPDGPRDCEAVGVDTQNRQVVLIAKSRFLSAGIYVVPLPPRQDERADPIAVTAQRVGTLPMPMITAMDVDPVSGDIWVVNYFQAYCFSCADRTESIRQRMSRTPRAHELPHWKQIEAVAVQHAAAVWVTTEGSPPWLGRVHIPTQTMNK